MIFIGEEYSLVFLNISSSKAQKPNTLFDLSCSCVLLISCSRSDGSATLACLWLVKTAETEDGSTVYKRMILDVHKRSCEGSTPSFRTKLIWRIKMSNPFKVGDRVVVRGYSPSWDGEGVVAALTTIPGIVTRDAVVIDFDRSTRHLRGYERGGFTLDQNVVFPRYADDDKYLADRFRKLRKEAAEIAKELIDRGYAITYSYSEGGPAIPIGRSTRSPDMNYFFVKKETVRTDL